jgi:hypothetical protein
MIRISTKSQLHHQPTSLAVSSDHPADHCHPFHRLPALFHDGSIRPMNSSRNWSRIAFIKLLRCSPRSVAVRDEICPVHNSSYDQNLTISFQTGSDHTMDVTDVITHEQ